jgi:beta-N-acetylhexosaminidase
MDRDILGVGLTGKSLTDLERRIIHETSPYAVVLFGRNIDTPDQLRELVREVKALARRPPIFMIDEEGGRVDRLRNIVPGLPSAEAFGEGEQPVEMSEWFGRIIGMALRWFDIECDLAPVVDIRSVVRPKGLERRTFGGTADDVVELAGAFMKGMHSAGVASCLKHFPGIGMGSADPHYGATVIDIPLEKLVEEDLAPFQRLGNAAGAVMIGHGTYPQVDDPDLPATLSQRITTDLLRTSCGFDGVAITDDMEMHAVSDLGSYEEISERAVMAGNDVILYCSHIERVPDLQRFFHYKQQTDQVFRRRFDDAYERAERYRRHCAQLRENQTASVETFEQLLELHVKFLEAFQNTRPSREIIIPDIERRKTSRTPGTGRTGREEWT